ncbi:unnamed protein product [Ostreobium quekettii]|uniref:Uncharacterized protein n=1 Tax=Ostreobium quekettii TaxID=121088 RepID=A0A8S1IN87_9CHLO|nr:unnamed protein product [Ostreobium quekettii]
MLRMDRGMEVCTAAGELYKCLVIIGTQQRPCWDSFGGQTSVAPTRLAGSCAYTSVIVHCAAVHRVAVVALLPNSLCELLANWCGSFFSDRCRIAALAFGGGYGEGSCRLAVAGWFTPRISLASAAD